MINSCQQSPEEVEIKWDFEAVTVDSCDLYHHAHIYYYKLGYPQ